MDRSWYVYILTNLINSVLYTGFTGDLQKRIWQHRNKVVEGFTKKYHLYKLVYYEIFDSPEEGIIREKRIKGMSREKKENLINALNPEWKDLYEDIIAW